MSYRKRDLAQPSLRALSFVLRHPQLWPKDFRWQFRECTNCAMALAARFWAIRDYIPDSHLAPHQMATAFNVPQEVARSLFIGPAERGLDYEYRPGIRVGDVTPEHVADAIDQFLAGVESDGSCEA